MEKKNFNQEVEEIKKGVDDLAHKMERSKFLLESETELAVRFSEAKRLLGDRPYNHQISTMIAEFKEYQSAGYAYDEALIATVWSSVKWDSTATKEKVGKAINKLLAYNPDRRVAYIRFKNSHRILVIVAYVLWCAMIFVGTQFWITQVTHDTFTRYFVPSMVTLYYAAFSHGFLRKKLY
ncbi:hypothetical protein GW791_00705 [Candidatus Saccharibacteria bacterium]|nr:hypothetical protein [Candidatus Saccharibacteria bacterium]